MGGQLKALRADEGRETMRVNKKGRERRAEFEYIHFIYAMHCTITLLLFCYAANI